MEWLSSFTENSKEMKVLIAGTGQKGWSKQEICSGKGNGGWGCKAILLVEEGDIYGTSRCHYDGSVDHYATFRCSECGVETDLADRDVPSRILNRLRNHK